MQTLNSSEERVAVVGNHEKLVNMLAKCFDAFHGELVVTGMVAGFKVVTGADQVLLILSAGITAYDSIVDGW